MKKSLHRLGRAVAFARADNRGGNAQRHFTRKARTGQGHNAIRRSLLAQNATHRVAGFTFNAFGDTDKNCRMTFQSFRHFAESLRRHSEHNALRAADGAFEIRLRLPIRGQRDTGEIFFVQTVLNGCKRRGIFVPQSHGVAVFLQDLGERRAPRARTEDSDSHFTPSDFLPSLFSVPAMSR